PTRRVRAPDGASVPSRLLPALFDSRPSAGRGGASATAVVPGLSKRDGGPRALRNPASARSAGIGATLAASGLFAMSEGASRTVAEMQHRLFEPLRGGVGI